MDQERADYGDPETPAQSALRFDLPVIGGAIVLMVLAFLPLLVLAAICMFLPRLA